MVGEKMKILKIYTSLGVVLEVVNATGNLTISTPFI